MTLWKAVERQIASIIGGVRVPITGRQRGDAPDVDHPFLSVEVKERQTLPSWLHEAMAQARAAKKTTDKHPVVILHEKGKQHAYDYVVMPLGIFVGWVLRIVKENEELRRQVEQLTEEINGENY